MEQLNVDISFVVKKTYLILQWRYEGKAQFELDVLRSFKYDKKRRMYVCGYQREKRRPILLQIDGPFKWTLMLYRDYLNKFTRARTRDEMDEHEANIFLESYADVLREKPIDLAKLPYKEHMIISNLKDPEDGLPQLRESIDSLACLEVR